MLGYKGKIDFSKKIVELCSTLIIEYWWLEWYNFYIILWKGMTKWLSVLVVGNKGQTINTMMGALSVMTALDSTLLARIAEEFLIVMTV